MGNNNEPKQNLPIRNRERKTEMSLVCVRAWGACGRQFEFTEAISQQGNFWKIDRKTVNY